MKWLSWLVSIFWIINPFLETDPVTFCEHYGAWELVMDVAWSGDGEYLAVSAGNNIYLYQAISGDDLRELRVYHVGSFSHSVQFSPDRKLLAAGSRDGVVQVWDLIDGDPAPMLSIDAHQKGVNVVAFASDRTFLASGGNDAVVRIWDLNTGDIITEMIGGTYAVPSFAISPDNQRIAITNGEVIRLREVATGQIWGTIRSPGWLYSIAYSPDGEVITAGDIDQRIHSWEVRQAYRTGVENYPQTQTLEFEGSDAAGYQTLVWDVTYHPDGDTLAVAYGDAAIRLWSLGSGQVVAEIDHHKAGVTSVSFNQDGTLLASGSLDGSVCITQIKN